MIDFNTWLEGIGDFTPIDNKDTWDHVIKQEISKVKVGTKIRYGYDRGLWIKITITEIEGWKPSSYNPDVKNFEVKGISRDGKIHTVNLYGSPWKFA